MTGTQAWRDWRETATDVCALPLTQRLAVLLDQDAGTLCEGAALPQGWHMVLFTSLAPQGTLGADGHPAGKDSLAPPGLPRRMLGGRRTQYHGTLPIGAAVQRTSRVTGLVERQGRSGRLVVLTLRHEIAAVGVSTPVVVEEQDVIYREAAGTVAAASTAAGAEEGAATATRETTAGASLEPLAARAFLPDPALLFRYSAVTFNAHRIHYDQGYATRQEGYPGLVVNGGLTALLLLELLKTVAERPLRWLNVRNRHPLFCGRVARLCVAKVQEGWTLWAEDDRGRIALEADAA